MTKVIYDLCAGTGAWSQPYREAGYDVRRVELRNGGDVRLLPRPEVNVHGVLAAPPCTHLAVSGARWWEVKGEEALLEGLAVVDACLRFIVAVNPKWWCLENPVGRLNTYLGKPVMYFNPCDYGDPYTKKTALWGRFTPPMKTPVEPKEGSKMHLIPPGPDRAIRRSQTPPGFARAFFKANQ